MTKLSAIVLLGNREDIVEACLKTLSWVDEIVVLDIGCQDKSLEIAKKYKVKIVRGSSQYDFSKWRSQGSQEAAGDWLLHIDTDERISAALAAEIKSEIRPIRQAQGKNPKSEINGFWIPRKNYFLGKEFKTVWPDYQLRLIKKDALISWQGKIHEQPKVKGEIGRLKNPLIHLSHRSLESCIENTLKWSKLEAENRQKAGHPKMTGWRFVRILLTGLWEQFILNKRWREGTEGVIEGIYQTFSLFFTYYRLWEIQRKESLKETYQKISNKIIN